MGYNSPEMHAPLSIIIPTLNAADRLAPVLRHIIKAYGAIEQDMSPPQPTPRKTLNRTPTQKPSEKPELIISDGGSSDHTLEIAQSFGAICCTGPPGRGGQLHRGSMAARAPWLLFLHADTQLSPGWPLIVAQHARHHPQDAAAFRLAFRATGMAPRLVAAWANLRSGLFDLPYGDQGLLIPRALYDQIGGYRDQPLMEDVDIAGRLHGRLRHLDCTAHTSPTRYIEAGWLRQGTANILRLIRYKCGTDPTVLAQEYHAPRPEGKNEPKSENGPFRHS